ncbi:MAG: NUDIX domain-containing protein [bacterium]|nr:NUDIX domain-containing protein [bacterium]
MASPSRRGAHYERWLTRYAQRVEQPPVPAATAVLLRDSPNGVETLLLRRNPDVPVMGGVWVFPGGRVDAVDRAAAGDRDDGYEAARFAAVREAEEEAGLQVDPHSLVRFSHWTPPQDFDHQLTTWFFLAPAPPGNVKVDGSEITEYIWLTPAEAHRRHEDSGGTWFLPPTWVTLHDLQEFATVGDALAAAERAEPRFFETRRTVSTGGEEVALWEGDAGFEAADPDVPGPRHRLRTTPGHSWRLERGGGDVNT